MFAAKLAQLSTNGSIRILSKKGSLHINKCISSAPCLMVRTQGLASRAGRSTLGRLRGTGTKGSVKNAAMAPASDTAFTIGKGLVAGASLVGVGALCFYGLGLSNQVGTIDKAALWPDIVKSRIRQTYMYFGGSLGITAATAVAISRSPELLRMLSSGGLVPLISTFALMIGTGYICRSLEYRPGFGGKQAMWILHSAVIGAVVAPLTILGGPLMIRAATYTAGVVGGLSTLAVCAPSEKFLNMGGPLAMGLGVVFMSSIGTWFLPPTTALGAGLYSIAMYGGLVLFSGFLLYDTQRIIKKAETHPVVADQPFDPVNNSISIYLDTINIFIRIAMMLAGGNRRK